jgi:hypothetical protein
MISRHSNINVTYKTGLFWVTMVILTLFSFSGDNSGSSSLEDTIRLNPDCKVKRLSNGSVIISSKNMEGMEEKHQFKDFYADLLMAAYRKQKTDYILASFSKKYSLSQDECRREIKHALNVLAQWNIVQRDDRMASR